MTKEQKIILAEMKAKADIAKIHLSERIETYNTQQAIYLAETQEEKNRLVRQIFEFRKDCKSKIGKIRRILRDEILQMADD